MTPEEIRVIALQEARKVSQTNNEVIGKTGWSDSNKTIEIAKKFERFITNG